MDKGPSLGDIAVLLTVAGTTTYLMGLVALAWPIYARITDNAIVTWHAVALIPKTVVVGLGARILFSFPVVITLGGLAFATVLIFGASVVAVFSDSSAIVIIAVVTMWAIGTWAFKWFFTRPSILWLISTGGGNPVPNSLRYLSNGLGYPLCFLAGILWPVKGMSIEWQGIIPHISVNGNWILVSVTIAFVGCFLLGLPLAASIDPPLPKVEIAISGGDESGTESVTGRLLGHVDGFWHMFTHADALVCVPDDKVTGIITTAPGSIWIVGAG